MSRFGADPRRGNTPHDSPSLTDAVGVSMRLSEAHTGVATRADSFSLGTYPFSPYYAVDLRYCIEIHVKRGGEDPPDYVWTREVIFDQFRMMMPTLMDVVIGRPGSAVLFAGQRHLNQGFSETEANELSAAAEEYHIWVGLPCELAARVHDIHQGKLLATSYQDERRQIDRDLRRQRREYRQHRSASPGQESQTGGETEDASEAESEAGSVPLTGAPAPRPPSASSLQPPISSMAQLGVIAAARLANVTRPGSPVWPAPGTVPPPRRRGRPPRVARAPTPPPPGSLGGEAPPPAREGRRERRERERERSGYETDQSERSDALTEGGSRRKKKASTSKINLPKFEDPAKDSYWSWRFDVARYGELFTDDSLLPHIYASLAGGPGELARSLGARITVSDLLAGMDVYYKGVDEYDVMCRKLYEIHQGYNETVAEFAVRLRRHISAIRNEYPENLALDEANLLRDRFRGGLRPELKAAMNYTRVPGPDGGVRSYAELLQIARQIEGAETKEFKRDYGPRKTPYQAPRSGHTTASARTATVEANEADKTPDPDSEPEEYFGEEAESEFPGINARITQAVNAYQQKHGRCFNCNEEGHFSRECPKKKEFQKKTLNSREGLTKKGAQTPNPPQKKTDP